jgi:hypothetical protein
MVETQVVLAGERPLTFEWKHRLLAVESVSDHWTELGRWWDGESPLEFFLVFAEGGLFLLARPVQGGTWHAKPVH